MRGTRPTASIRQTGGITIPIDSPLRQHMSGDGTAKPDGGTKRAWYHLHVVTVIVVITATYLSLAPEIKWWPFLGYRVLEPLFDVNYATVALNACVHVVVLSGTVAALEGWLRSANKLRFRLTDVCRVVITLALVLTLARWDYSVSKSPHLGLRPIGMDVKYVSISDNRMSESLPLLFCIACTIHTATRLAGWCFRFVARRFRRSPGGST